eukprot:c34762_g1_i1 orf=109-303(-)
MGKTSTTWQRDEPPSSSIHLYRLRLPQRSEAKDLGSPRNSLPNNLSVCSATPPQCYHRTMGAPP